MTYPIPMHSLITYDLIIRNSMILYILVPHKPYSVDLLNDHRLSHRAWVILVILNPAVFAILSLTTAEYMMKPFFVDCAVPFWAKKIFSIWIVGL